MSLRTSLAVLLACVACDRQEPRETKELAAEPAKEPDSKPRADDWTLPTIESLGERAAYVVVLDLSRWSEVHRHLAALSQPGSEAQLLLAADEPGHWLDVALAAAGITRRDAEPIAPLQGLDPTRPLILALAEPPDGVSGRDFAAGLPLISGTLPGLRHELVLPSANVEQLQRSLGALLDRLGTPRPELVTGHANASGWQLGEVPVVVLTGANEVRVIALTHNRELLPDAWTPPQLPRAPAAPALRTAGVIAATLPDAPLSLLVRAQALARLTLWRIAREGLVDTILPLPARHRQRAAIQRSIRCELLLRDSGREFPDWTLGLVADNSSVGLRLVASLGPTGLDRFTASAPAPGEAEDVLARAWLNIAPDAFLAAARGVPSPMAARSEVATFTDTCGERVPTLLGPGPLDNLQQLHTLIRLGMSSAGAEPSYALAGLRTQLDDLPGLVPLLAHERLHMDLRRSGQALVGRWTLAPSPQHAAPLDLSQVTWPERQVPPRDTDSCGFWAARQVAVRIDDPEILGAAASARVVRDAPGLGGAAALEEIEAALRCPEPLPAATVDNLRRLSTLALAGGLIDEWRTDEAAKLLLGGCAGTRDPRLCLDAGDATQLSAPHIPDVFVLCEGLAWFPAAHRVGLDATGLALDDRRLADLTALRLALEALVLAEGGPLELDIGIDKDLRFAAARPLLALLGTIKGLKLTLALRSELGRRGEVLRLPIAAPELGPTQPGEPAPSARHQAGAVVFAVDGGSIRIRTGVINLGVDANPSPGALRFATADHLDNGEPPLVHATDDSPWSTVAIALAGSCSGARLVEPARELALLGRAWRDADCLAVYYGPKPLSVVPPHRGPNNINSGLIGVRPKLEACYAAGLLEDPKLAGRVVATYAIEANGDVTAATVTSARLNSPTVQRCMADAIRTGSHSSADGPVVVRYAFDFKTRRH